MPTGRYPLLQAYGLCHPLALQLPRVSFLLCWQQLFQTSPLPYVHSSQARPTHPTSWSTCCPHVTASQLTAVPMAACPSLYTETPLLLQAGSFLCSTDAVEPPPRTLCSWPLQPLSGISLCSLTAHPSILSMVLLSATWSASYPFWSDSVLRPPSSAQPLYLSGVSAPLAHVPRVCLLFSMFTIFGTDSWFLCMLSWFGVSDSANLWRSPLGSSVLGSLQERILKWVAMPSSRGSSQPRDRTHVSYVSCIGRQVLYC